MSTRTKRKIKRLLDLSERQYRSGPDWHKRVIAKKREELVAARRARSGFHNMRKGKNENRNG